MNLAKVREQHRQDLNLELAASKVTFLNSMSPEATRHRWPARQILNDKSVWVFHEQGFPTPTCNEEIKHKAKHRLVGGDASVTMELKNSYSEIIPTSSLHIMGALKMQVNK